MLLENSAVLLDDSETLVGDIDALFSKQAFSDVTFVINGERFPAHKPILAARSEHFGVMLDDESTGSVVQLQGTDPVVFRTILKFLYSAKVELSAFNVDELLAILHLSHEYRLTKIHQAVADYIKAKLNNIGNFFTILRTSSLLLLEELTESCLKFADEHAPQVLAAQEFTALSLKLMLMVLSRDSFCAAEIDIFHAICRWIEAQPPMEATPVEMLIKSLILKNCLRLHLMSPKELFTTVRSSALFVANWPRFEVFINDAMERKSQGISTGFRGLLLPDENVATVRLGAAVLAGACTQTLLNDGREISNSEGSRMASHKFGKEEGIVVGLGRAYTINSIVLQQPDWQLERAHSCHVDVSLDRCKWERVVDRTECPSTSVETLMFDARLVRYIRVFGSHNSRKYQYFALVGLEALYSMTHAQIDNSASLVYHKKI